MADIVKIYKQLKLMDNDDRVEYNESTGKLEVYGDYVSAEAVDQGRLMDINIQYEEDEYTSLTDNSPLAGKAKTAFGILSGVLDGSLVPEIDENDDKLLYLKRDPKVKATRMITGGSIAAMLSGILLFILSLCIAGFCVKRFIVGEHIKGEVLLFLLLAVIMLIVFGVILVCRALKLAEITDNTYLFSRVDKLPDEATIKRILQAVCEKTRTDAIEVKLDCDRIPTLFSSKIGGVPYWDMSKPYPTDGNGEKMVMLAQFNLSELPENNKLPKNGMLQFFIAPDASFGRYFDGSSDGHKVVYHSSIDDSLTEEQVWKLGISTSLENDCFPVIGEFAVNFNKVRVFMSPADGRINDVIKDASNRMGIYSETYDAQVLFSDEQIEMLKEHSVDHGLFGYPCFIQWDPRGNTEAKKYDVLLFQLSSESKNTDSEIYPGRKIMWGDGGVCQFFINEFALSKLDFSDVLYSWEC